MPKRISAPPNNEQTIEQYLAAALDTNRAFLALTKAEREAAVHTQVRDLTRQMIRVERMLLRRFEAVE